MAYRTALRARAVLIGMLTLLPIGASAQDAQKDQLEAPEVRGLTLTGVTSVDHIDLLKSISTQPSKCRSLLLTPFCLVSHSPTFEFKHYFDETEFRRDVLRIRLYYWKRGYRSTQVDTAVKHIARGQVAVTFNVHEGPPTRVHSLSIVYDSTLINDKTRNRLTFLHANDPLDLILLDSMRTAFQAELWDRGYGDAVVDTTVRVDTGAHLADVLVRLTPNHATTIGRIVINGNQRVDNKTILNSLAFKTGDLYRQSTVLESQRNLYESNLFRLASIDVPVQYDTSKNVNIDVVEAPLHDARFGPGLNNVDFVQFQAHYTAYNMLSGARRLDVNGTIGNLFASSLQGRGVFHDVSKDVAAGEDVSPYLSPTYTASIDFRQPAFLQRPADAVGFGGFAHRTINPGVFVDQGYGGQATYTHTIRPRAPISLNYRYEDNRVSASDVYFCVDFGVCDTQTINTLRLDRSLSPITITGFVDRSDLPFSPTKGYVARLDLETASAYTLSDYRYNRLFFDGAAYGHRSGSRNVYTAHLRFGFVHALSGGDDNDIIHPRKRFYAGGANSVRGYGENQLGPRILTIDAGNLDTTSGVGGGICRLTVAAVKYCNPDAPGISRSAFVPQPLGGTSLLEGSVEYRFPIPITDALRHLMFAAFVDGAIVGSGDIRGFQTVSTIVKGTGAITPGFGLRYESPVGPVRVDIGINPNRAEDLTVVTAVPGANGQRVIVPLSVKKNYAQGRTFLDRLTLHFSIGEAY